VRPACRLVRRRRRRRDWRPMSGAGYDAEAERVSGFGVTTVPRREGRWATASCAVASSTRYIMLMPEERVELHGVCPRRILVRSSGHSALGWGGI